MEGADIDVIWSNKLEETGEPGKITNLRRTTTPKPHLLIRANEKLTVLRYWIGYGRIGSESVHLVVHFSKHK